VNEPLCSKTIGSYTVPCISNANSPLVICCADIVDPNWRWLEHAFKGAALRFEFTRASPRSIAERAVGFINLSRLRSSFEAVWLAQKKKAHIIVAHGPSLTAWCALFAVLFRLRIPIVGHSFNFVQLPTGIRRLVFRGILSRVDRLVVFSAMERKLYVRAFGLPENRFDVIRWGVQAPIADPPNTPLVKGDYICAIGGNGRDYSTLLEAAKLLPHIRFICVVRSHNFAGLDVPGNVTKFTDLPLGTTINILKYSRLMVLPLLHSEIPCGHVTLVAAMYLGVPMVVTHSEGIRDYITDSYNALTVPPRSPSALAIASKKLWDEPGLRKRLSENGSIFVNRECTEERTVEHFRRLLVETGLLL
jgi:glycosyltransferase involved in cell wall biosynthesis